MSSIRTLLLATFAAVGAIAVAPAETQATYYYGGGYYSQPYYGGGYYGGGYRGGYYGNRGYYGGRNFYGNRGFYGGRNYGFNSGRRGYSIYTPYGGFSYRSGRRW